MTERQYRERERQRRKKREAKRRRARRKRLLLIGCMGVVLAGAIALALAAAGKWLGGGKNGSLPVVGGVRETAEAQHMWTELPRIGVLCSICPAGGEWSSYVADNRCASAPAGSYLTAMKAALESQPEELTGTLKYSVNLSGSGWLDWTDDSGESGESGGDAALEAIRMRLTGDLANYYDILYCVLQNDEWTDWVKNGEEAGSSGVGLHVDGVRASVVRKKPGEASWPGEIDPTQPMVAITYDDGPSGTVTPKILDKLEACGGHATFFMVGQQAENRSELIQRMISLGCEPANHTYEHIAMKNLEPQELVAQVNRTNQLVIEACGVTPVLMRPVGGNETDEGLAAVGSIGMSAILWSIDTLDWKTRDASSTIQKVRDNVKDGDIILMHDLYDATAEASMTIIDELVAQGYQLVTISELSAYRGGLKPGVSYTKFAP